jgi:hypothetical protein
MSTKSTDAPQYNAQFAEATNVMGLVHKTSPLPRPKAKQAKCNAAVQEFKATAYSAPIYFANSCSNLLVFGPLTFAV